MTLAFLSTAGGAGADGTGPAARTPLAPLLTRAGAVMAVEDGWQVAAHFGSAAGELAVCRRTVGIGDRSQLGKLELQGDAESVEQVVRVLAGGPPVLGEALWRDHTWWCPVTRNRVLALCDPPWTAEQRERLERAAAEAPFASVVDLTSAFACVGVVGPRAREVLARLTALDVRATALPEGGFRPGSLAQVPAMLLRERDDRFLVLVGAAHAEYAWISLQDAGEPLGASCVGAEALGRVAIAEREVARHA